MESRKGEFEARRITLEFSELKSRRNTIVPSLTVDGVLIKKLNYSGDEASLINEKIVVKRAHY